MVWTQKNIASFGGDPKKVMIVLYACVGVHRFYIPLHIDGSLFIKNGFRSRCAACADGQVFPLPMVPRPRCTLLGRVQVPTPCRSIWLELSLGVRTLYMRVS